MLRITPNVKQKRKAPHGITHYSAYHEGFFICKNEPEVITRYCRYLLVAVDESGIIHPFCLSNIKCDFELILKKRFRKHFNNRCGKQSNELFQTGTHFQLASAVAIGAFSIGKQSKSNTSDI